jgi:hypothetical protein
MAGAQRACYVCYSLGMTNEGVAMSLIGKLWTGAVAYVSLLAGAGLSIAGNVADTYRMRGTATDALDVILAGAAPALVLLTVEMFVSPRWAPDRGFQALRWLGCGLIGSLAMLVSWVHLHDLLATRGQLEIVSVAWPFAIDGMAIMATGLILSTRVRPVVSGPVPDSAGQNRTVPTVAELEDMFSLSDLLPRPLPVPVSPPPAPGRTVTRTIAPTEMDSAVAGLLSLGVLDVKIKRDIAEVYGVSTKTVGRRIAALSMSALPGMDS